MSDLLVLGYHAVSSNWRSDLSVTPRRLERQLRSLVRQGYRGACFYEAVTAATQRKTLVVTFDDAYCSVLDLALPVMERLGLPGVVFVPTRFADSGGLASWRGVDSYLGGPDAHELKVMSWEQLSQLQSRGWEIGSHTVSHPHLTELEDDTLHEELTESRLVCEQRLGSPCHSLAFPYGDTNARVIRFAEKAGYSAAAGLPRFRQLHPAAPLNWPRIGVFHNDGAGRFKLKVSPVARRLRTRPAPA